MNEIRARARATGLSAAFGFGSRDVSTQRESAYRGRQGAARAGAEQARRADIGDDGGRGSEARRLRLTENAARRSNAR